MSGALAERVFVKKLTNVGFRGVRVLERHSFSLDDAARYPLFTPELISAMRDLIPPERQAELASSITVVAVKPSPAT